MFRGKESSNRIELSRLVQDLLNFGLLGSLWLWGWGGWMDGGGGWLGGAPHIHAHACTHMHAHARTCTHVKHDNFMQMAAPIWGNPWEFPMVSYVCVHACACMCIHVHMCGGTLSPPPTPIHPPPTPQGGPPESVKIQ